MGRGSKHGKADSKPQDEAGKKYGSKVKKEAAQLGADKPTGENQYGKFGKGRDSSVGKGKAASEATSIDEQLGLPDAKPNRVILAVQKCRDHIRQRILDNKLTPAMAEQTRKNLDMEIVEYCTFQELKSLAASQGYLTLEEAQTVYVYLGGSPSTFNDQPLEVKMVLTQLAAELLSWRMKAGGLQKI